MEVKEKSTKYPPCIIHCFCERGVRLDCGTKFTGGNFTVADSDFVDGTAILCETLELLLVPCAVTTKSPASAVG